MLPAGNRQQLHDDTSVIILFVCLFVCFFFLSLEFVTSNLFRDDKSITLFFFFLSFFPSFFLSPWICHFKPVPWRQIYNFVFVCLFVCLFVCFFLSFCTSFFLSEWICRFKPVPWLKIYTFPFSFFLSVWICRFKPVPWLQIYTFSFSFFLSVWICRFKPVPWLQIYNFFLFFFFFLINKSIQCILLVILVAVSRCTDSRTSSLHLLPLRSYKFGEKRWSGIHT